MASIWNEDWDEIRKHSSRKYNITLWTNPTCENGLQPKWGLGGWHVWPSSSATVTLREIFLADMLSWDMYEVNLPQYVNAVVQFFSRISHCFPISHFLGYWKPNWLSSQLGNLTNNMSAIIWDATKRIQGEYKCSLRYGVSAYILLVNLNLNLGNLAIWGEHGWKRKQARGFWYQQTLLF